MKKNLINIQQIRQDQLSGYALQVSSGYVQAYVSGASGHLDGRLNATGQYLEGLINDIEAGIGVGGGGALGFRVNLASGVDTVHCAYGETLSATTKVAAQVSTTNLNDPIVFGMVTKSNATGVQVELSDSVSSSNYYLDFILSV